jgi:hypothetical protein
MSEQALSHVVLRLVEKRKEITKQTEALQCGVRALVTYFDHVDAKIRLFAPREGCGDKLRRPVPPPCTAFRRRIAWLVLDVLRETPKPLSPKVVVEAIIKDRGLRPTICSGISKAS